MLLNSKKDAFNVRVKQYGAKLPTGFQSSGEQKSCPSNQQKAEQTGCTYVCTVLKHHWERLSPRSFLLLIKVNIIKKT
jgi:hypothetical protein